ncbi:hypothetical protein JCM24511_08911 [Saitozyma sp. JCM 24511]|nr:hypothetical protein JCM24511_08911 [Saitozyma sp. JCM 24511]
MIQLDDEAFRFGVATASLGMHPSHTMERKFAAMQQARIKYTEIGFAGYMEWVRSMVPDLPRSTCPPDWCEGDEPDPSDEEIWRVMDTMAGEMLSLAKRYGLTILAVQPLNQFEGWPAGSVREEWGRRKAERWLRLCSKLAVELIQVGSNDKADANLDQAKTARDLHWLAELGAKQTPVVKIAYESWCFSRNLDSWEQTWKVVQMADHPNLGLCLDTAQFPLAREYGWDPVTGSASGWTTEQSTACLERLKTVPAEKIFYVEISDVLAPTVPLGKGSAFDAWRSRTQSPRGDAFVWAICGRPVPLVGKDAGRSVRSQEDYGGARVVDALSAILSTGYRGESGAIEVSEAIEGFGAIEVGDIYAVREADQEDTAGPMLYEVFEAVSMEKDDGVPEVYAAACAESQRKLMEMLRAYPQQ